MSNRSRIVVALGTAAVATYFCGVALELPALAYATKLLPVLAMMVAVLPAASRYSKSVLVGLALSMVGDALLMVPPSVKDLFVPGLLAFLAAHISYIVAFQTPVAGTRPPWAPLRALPAVLLGAVMAYVVLPKAGGLAIPVGAYMVVILGMLWRATARAGGAQDGAAAGIAGMVGALLFVASDTTLAIHRFVEPVGASQYVIMVTYWLGQLGITVSAVRLARSSPSAG